MIKDYCAYMKDGEEAFEQVLAACDELINAKVILAETKVSVLLQKIAESKKAYSLLDDVLKGFDFNYEFTLAKRRNAVGAYTLVLPSDDRRLAALVFCLLLEFDTTSCDLQSFLDVYYYGDTPANEFAMFVRDMIVPFKQAISSLYYDGGVLSGGGDERLTEGEAASAPRLPVGNATDINSLFTDLTAMSDKLHEAELAQSDFDDAVVSLTGLSRALSAADRDGIRLAYTAFKRTVSSLDALEILDEQLLAFGKKLVALGAVPAV